MGFHCINHMQIHINHMRNTTPVVTKHQSPVSCLVNSLPRTPRINPIIPSATAIARNPSVPCQSGAPSATMAALMVSATTLELNVPNRDRRLKRDISGELSKALDFTIDTTVESTLATLGPSKLGADDRRQATALNGPNTSSGNRRSTLEEDHSTSTSKSKEDVRRDSDPKTARNRRVTVDSNGKK